MRQCYLLNTISWLLQWDVVPAIIFTLFPWKRKITCNKGSYFLISVLLQILLFHTLLIVFFFWNRNFFLKKTFFSYLIFFQYFVPNFLKYIFSYLIFYQYFVGLVCKENLDLHVKPYDDIFSKFVHTES